MPCAEVMPVETPEKILPAIQRLKNFDPDVIDLSSFERGKGVDGMMSQTFEPLSLSQNDSVDPGNDDNDEGTFEVVPPVEAYHDALKEIQTGISEQTRKLFSESLDDTDFPHNLMKNLSTREILKQK